MSPIRAVVFDCYGTLVDILTDEGKDEVDKACLAVVGPISDTKQLQKLLKI